MLTSKKKDRNHSARGETLGFWVFSRAVKKWQQLTDVVTMQKRQYYKKIRSRCIHEYSPCCTALNIENIEPEFRPFTSVRSASAPCFRPFPNFLYFSSLSSKDVPLSRPQWIHRIHPRQRPKKNIGIRLFLRGGVYHNLHLMQQTTHKWIKHKENQATEKILFISPPKFVP